MPAVFTAMIGVPLGRPFSEEFRARPSEPTCLTYGTFRSKYRFRPVVDRSDTLTGQGYGKRGPN